jgi:ABC-type multidrug transport system ATPase subunit
MDIWFDEAQSEPRPSEPGSLVLKRTEWNDWFRWRTLFYAYFVDPSSGELVPVGAVKIADADVAYDRTPDGGVTTPLPARFSKRPGRIISLGQDESYYLNLRALLGLTKMREVLRALGDLAFNPKLWARYRSRSVVYESLLRSIPSASVDGVFSRIIKTGKAKVAFEFSYLKPSQNKLVTEPMRMEFSVVPDSKPPTNVHVLIGRNGAGKTTVMRSMARSLVDPNSNPEEDGWFEPGVDGELGIANVVYIAFSAFDEAVVPVIDIANSDRSYSYVGLQYVGAKTQNQKDSAVKFIGELEKPRINTRSVSALEGVFAQSAWAVARVKSIELWLSALKDLESDRNFKDAKVAQLAELITAGATEAEFKREARRLYKLLSSGHKIVLLTVTRLVETVTDKTLVLLDEPEGHLHPPLLSAFVRALSELLRARNGIAIVSTHSPVIVQEVPVSCVYKLVRDGRTQTAERLSQETFGENAGTLTSTVFGLEVEESGFHRMIKEAAERLESYDEVADEFDRELGFEARAALRAILANRDS